MKTFEGYDEFSPTLRQGFAIGSCMGPTWDGCLIWTDASAAIFSGDYVRLLLRAADGSEFSIVKRLECDRAGFWYAIAETEGVMPLILYTPSAEPEKIVARAPSSARPPRGEFAHHASPEDFRVCAVYSAHARAEWQREGFVRGAPWPGFGAVLARGYPPEVRA